jgi:hypothetical protein
MANGIYSLIQYCPNRFRAEAVNVGLAVVCSDSKRLRVRLTTQFDRAQRLFGISKSEIDNLKLAAKAIQNRIEKLQTHEELSAFACSRANDLRLTTPRIAKIKDVDADFERLFSDLVD